MGRKEGKKEEFSAEMRGTSWRTEKTIDYAKSDRRVGKLFSDALDSNKRAKGKTNIPGSLFQFARVLQPMLDKYSL